MHDDSWTTSKDENIFQMYVAHGGPEAPDWAGSANLRPLDDPRLDAALAQLDRKRYKAPGIAHANDKARVRLNVTYEQKDVAKNLGARWDRAEKFWWLPADNHAAISRAKELGFLRG